MYLLPVATDRVIPDKYTCAQTGRIVFEPLKTAWLLAMTLGGVFGLVQYFSWSAVLVFTGLSAITLCAGHSVGMHRLLIHRSFITDRDGRPAGYDQGP